MSTIGRNTIYNLAGFAVPLALFAVSIPVYIWMIGAERYGVLAIAWLVLGFSGFLDLGLGRAVTQKIASLHESTDGQRKVALDCALAANVPVGLVAAGIMAMITWAIFGWAMKLEPWLRSEAIELVPLMALGVPVVTTLGIFNGALQGREKFAVTNRITIINSAMFQLVPLAVAALNGPRLWPLVLAAIVARAVAIVLLRRACRKEFGHGEFRWNRNGVYEMARYGGWIAAAGILGMVLVYSDRVLIGALIGPVAVAIYAIAFDTTLRVSLISNSLMMALFPRFAGAGEAAFELTEKAIRYLFAITTPIIVAGIFASDFIFPLWLGEEIGVPAAGVAKLCLIGSWATAFGKIGHTRLQAGGKPELVLWSVSGQMVVFIPLMALLTMKFGVIGAAMAFALRQAFDAAILYWLAYRRTTYLLRYVALMALLIACWQLTLMMMEEPLVLRLAIAAAALLPVVIASYFAAPRLYRYPVELVFSREKGGRG